jgi:GT2 family glycosyltransferase
MKVGFVFTNYNNSHFTRQAIHSISLNDNFDNCYIVVVDNKSEIEDIELLKLIKIDYPHIEVIFNEVNLGYFKGLNIGIKYLRDKYEELDNIVIGNNDLFFPIDFVNKLISFRAIFEIHPIISPDIITIDGVHQNPHVVEKISKFRELIYDIYYSNYFISLVIGHVTKITKKYSARKDYYQFEIAQSIYQGYGACYILGPLFFENFNILDAPVFLMGEEFFLSKQLEDKGFKIYYDPYFSVIHHDHATVGKLPTKKLWTISRESHKIYRKYIKVL